MIVPFHFYTAIILAGSFVNGKTVPQILEEYSINIWAERHRSVQTQYCSTNTKLGVEYDEIPSRLRISPEEVSGEQACAVSLKVRLLKDYFHRRTLCLYRDSKHDDEVFEKDFTIDVEGLQFTREKLYEQVNPVVGFIPGEVNSVVKGFVIKNEFYGTVRLFDKFRLYHILFYIEPTSNVKLYSPIHATENIPTKEEDNTVIFEYIPGPGIPDAPWVHVDNDLKPVGPRPLATPSTADANATESAKNETENPTSPAATSNVSEPLQNATLNTTPNATINTTANATLNATLNTTPNPTLNATVNTTRPTETNSTQTPSPSEVIEVVDPKGNQSFTGTNPEANSTHIHVEIDKNPPVDLVGTNVTIKFPNGTEIPGTIVVVTPGGTDPDRAPELVVEITPEPTTTNSSNTTSAPLIHSTIFENGTTTLTTKLQPFGRSTEATGPEETPPIHSTNDFTDATTLLPTPFGRSTVADVGTLPSLVHSTNNLTDATTLPPTPFGRSTEANMVTFSSSTPLVHSTVWSNESATNATKSTVFGHSTEASTLLVTPFHSTVPTNETKAVENSTIGPPHSTDFFNSSLNGSSSVAQLGHSTEGPQFIFHHSTDQPLPSTKGFVHYHSTTVTPLVYFTHHSTEMSAGTTKKTTTFGPSVHSTESASVSPINLFLKDRSTEATWPPFAPHSTEGPNVTIGAEFAHSTEVPIATSPTASNRTNMTTPCGLNCTTNATTVLFIASTEVSPTFSYFHSTESELMAVPLGTKLKLIGTAGEVLLLGQLGGKNGTHFVVKSDKDPENSLLNLPATAVDPDGKTVGGGTIESILPAGPDGPGVVLNMFGHNALSTLPAHSTFATTAPYHSTNAEGLQDGNNSVIDMNHSTEVPVRPLHSTTLVGDNAVGNSGANAESDASGPTTPVLHSTPVSAPLFHSTYRTDPTVTSNRSSGSSGDATKEPVTLYRSTLVSTPLMHSTVQAGSGQDTGPGGSGGMTGPDGQGGGPGNATDQGNQGGGTGPDNQNGGTGPGGQASQKDLLHSTPVSTLPYHSTSRLPIPLPPEFKPGETNPGIPIIIQYLNGTNLTNPIGVVIDSNSTHLHVNASGIYPALVGQHVIVINPDGQNTQFVVVSVGGNGGAVLKPVQIVGINVDINYPNGTTVGTGPVLDHNATHITIGTEVPPDAMGQNVTVQGPNGTIFVGLVISSGDGKTEIVGVTVEPDAGKLVVVQTMGGTPIVNGTIVFRNDTTLVVHPENVNGQPTIGTSYVIVMIDGTMLNSTFVGTDGANLVFVTEELHLKPPTGAPIRVIDDNKPIFNGTIPDRNLTCLVVVPETGTPGNLEKGQTVVVEDLTSGTNVTYYVQDFNETAVVLCLPHPVNSTVPVVLLPSRETVDLVIVNRTEGPPEKIDFETPDKGPINNSLVGKEIDFEGGHWIIDLVNGSHVDATHIKPTPATTLLTEEPTPYRSTDPWLTPIPGWHSTMFTGPTEKFSFYFIGSTEGPFHSTDHDSGVAPTVQTGPFIASTEYSNSSNNEEEQSPDPRLPTQEPNSGSNDTGNEGPLFHSTEVAPMFFSTEVTLGDSRNTTGKIPQESGLPGDVTSKGNSSNLSPSTAAAETSKNQTTKVNETTKDQKATPSFQFAGSTEYRDPSATTVPTYPSNFIVSTEVTNIPNIPGGSAATEKPTKEPAEVPGGKPNLDHSTLIPDLNHSTIQPPQEPSQGKNDDEKNPVTMTKTTTKFETTIRHDQPSLTTAITPKVTDGSTRKMTTGKQPDEAFISSTDRVLVTTEAFFSSTDKLLPQSTVPTGNVRRKRRKKRALLFNFNQFFDENAIEQEVDSDDVDRDLGLTPGLTHSHLFDTRIEKTSICSLCVWIQPHFAESFGLDGGLLHGIAEVIDIIKMANWAFRAIDFNQDGIPENIGFKLRKILLTDDIKLGPRNESARKKRHIADPYKSDLQNDLENYKYQRAKRQDYFFDYYEKFNLIQNSSADVSNSSSADGMREKLNNFSRDPMKIVPKSALLIANDELQLKFADCCAILGFIYHDMAPSIATTSRRGLCTGSNLALISGFAYNRKISKMDVFRGVMHTLGHLFGAGHDSYADPECFDSTIYEFLNPFAMHPIQQTNVGMRPNSFRFSHCAKDEITMFLSSSAAECMDEITETFCGNGVLEEKEICDCGSLWQCHLTYACCGERDTVRGCQIVNPSKKNCHRPTIW